MNDDRNVWYEHILAQMAAESYLDAEDDPDFDFKIESALRQSRSCRRGLKC